jgi:NitT/TauT family transport system permease protein
VLGVAAGASSLARSGISPILTVLRATPVMSVILLALIWFQSNWVPVFVAFLMVFPILCGNTIEGVRNVDRGLLKMAQVYGVRRRRVIAGIYLPSIIPYLLAAMTSAVGITWKVVIAAEVLSQPLHAVGSGLQLAKYRLDTADVFAWTVIAIVLTALSEQGLELVDRSIPWRRNRDGD